MFKVNKIKNSTVHKAIVILEISLIYSVVFYYCYSIIGDGIISHLSLIPSLLISWKWGIKAGILITTLNIIVWTNLIVTFKTPQHSFFQLHVMLAIITHFSFSLIVGILSTLNKKLRHEIIERKCAENKLLQYRKHLEEMVRIRTEELQEANEKLFQKRKMEAIGQLAGGIAHEFNNQLTTVLGYTEILMKRFNNDPNNLKHLNQIYSSGKKASNLTKQLLAFARKGVYKMEIVNINSLSNQTIILLKQSIDKSINIVTKFEAESPYFWGGLSQLQNAILNIAQKACDELKNGDTLTIRTGNMKIDQKFSKAHSLNIKTGDAVFITIQDTGHGMNEETKNHIFEPFFTTNKEKSTGMGLAAVFGIVKSHNGDIIVESKLQVGSSFTLLFPCTSCGEICDIPEVKYNPDDKKINVLIIDDEKEVADTIKEMLIDSRFTANIAHSSREAIDLYRFCWQIIDIVIIDMVMPEQDGSQTFNALKQINPKVKAIITSGYTQNTKIALTLQDGAKCYLQKPYTKQELTEKIICIHNNIESLKN